MKNLVYAIGIVALMFFVSSCENEGISFGKVEYYPSFLWKDSSMTFVKKTIDFDFSPDARNDLRSSVDLQFVDNEGRPVSMNVMCVCVDGKRLESNILHVDNTVTSKELVIMFTPEAVAGKYQGYLRLLTHELDRVDSQAVISGQEVDVFQWTILFEKRMNPLAKLLMWILIVFVVSLFCWFVFFKQLFYPRFGKFRKSVVIEKDGAVVAQIVVVFNGARQVVFSNRKIKQSQWSRIFTGKVRTIIHPYFTIELVFTPWRKGAFVRSKDYFVAPNPIPRTGMATLTNREQKMKIIMR